jgi:hypothetical protein
MLVVAHGAMFFSRAHLLKLMRNVTVASLLQLFCLLNLRYLSLLHKPNARGRHALRILLL